MGDRELSRLSQIIYDGASQGLRYEEIARQVADLGGVSERQAAFIARDQVSSFNGVLTQLRQTHMGLSRYRWRGVLDERERPEHLAREGQIFEWSKPPSDGHPGIPKLCRCIAEPVLEDLLEDDGGDE
jgi:SPP1 gp7 family putative phage head morphogenesis protein